MNRNREVWRDNRGWVTEGLEGQVKGVSCQQFAVGASANVYVCVHLCSVCLPEMATVTLNLVCMERVHHWFKKKKNLPDASSSLIGTIILLVRLSDLLDNLNFILPSFPESTLSSSWLTPFAFGTLCLDLHSHLTHSPAFSPPTSSVGYCCQIHLPKAIFHSCYVFLQWLMEPGH